MPLKDGFAFDMDIQEKMNDRHPLNTSSQLLSGNLRVDAQ